MAMKCKLASPRRRSRTLRGREGAASCDRRESSADPAPFFLSPSPSDPCHPWPKTSLWIPQARVTGRLTQRWRTTISDGISCDIDPGLRLNVIGRGMTHLRTEDPRESILIWPTGANRHPECWCDGFWDGLWDGLSRNRSCMNLTEDCRCHRVKSAQAPRLRPV